MQTMKELYNYREMIFSLVKRDLRGRYKGSALGFLWTFLNPLLQLAVYTVVFSVIMKAGIDKFYLFLFVALVPWLFFGTCLSGGASCIWAQQDMVKKIYFPREVLPLSYTISQFINMLLSFLVIFVVLIFSGVGIDFKAVLYLPLIMSIEFVLALGITFITSSVTVYLRDLEYVLGIIQMVWMYMTPILYSIEMVPEELQGIFALNPMTSIVVAYRDILYYKQVPDLSTLLQAGVLGGVILIIGIFVFEKLKRNFAEEL